MSVKNKVCAILLFDGVCNLCDGTVRFIINKDSKKCIKFAALQSVGGREIIEQIRLEANYLKSLVLIIGDKYYLKSDAVFQILSILGGVWKLFYVFKIIPKPIRDYMYDLIAKYRYKVFGRKEICMIPTEEIRQRFLE
jgi:predicted DCC family thiol-disulfide oxidoreductase YuxK